MNPIRLAIGEVCPRMNWPTFEITQLLWSLVGKNTCEDRCFIKNQYCWCLSLQKEKDRKKLEKKEQSCNWHLPCVFFKKFGSTQHRKRLLFFSKQGLKVIFLSLFVYIVMFKGTFMAKSFHNCPGPDRGYGWTWWDSKRDRGTQRVFECLHVRWGSWRLLLW